MFIEGYAIAMQISLGDNDIDLGEAMPSCMHVLVDVNEYVTAANPRVIGTSIPFEQHSPLAPIPFLSVRARKCDVYLNS